jgi:hypothetical protein
MRSILKPLTGFAFAAIILFGLGATLASGKPEYTKKEGKACTVCHVKAGSKELNDVGKCYAKDHSLKDCKVPEKK